MSGETYDAEDLDLDCSSWPDAEKAAKQLGVSRRSFDRLFKDGKIDRYKVGERLYRYDPKQVALLQATDAEGIDLQDAPTAALLAQAYAHNEVLLERTNALTNDLLGLYKQESQVLRERVMFLEKTHSELIKAREEALNESTMRDAAISETVRSQDRKDKAVDELFKLAPHVLANRAGSKFLASLSEQQLMMAEQLGSDIWTEEQLKTISTLRQTKAATTAPKPNGKAESVKGKS